MKTQALVTAVHKDGTATVSIDRRAACDGCHKNEEGKECSVCSLLGGDRTLCTRAKNSLGAEVGDLVLVESATSRMLFYAVLVFLVPLLAAIAGYLIAAALGGAEWLPPAVAGGALVLSFAALAVYSRAVVSARVDAQIVAVLTARDDRA